MGKRNGFEREQQAQRGPVAVPGMGRAAPKTIDAKPEPVAPLRPLPDAASPAGATLQRMQQVDRNFSPERFIAGADAAFRMIVEGYAAGDRVALRPLLGDETYRNFEGAIAAREAAGETQKSEIRSIEHATIDKAGLDGTMGTITVRFVSDQVSETLDRDGKPVHGTDAVTEITDIWTFERDLSQSDPAWRMTEAHSG